MQRKIRVLVGKPGLDGHDRGAKVVAAALRDAGMEVIYTGLHQSPEQVVEAALQEDVDVVALSILSGAHMTLFPEVLALMNEKGLEDRLLTGGGIIPPEDMQTLADQGVGRLFGPGSSTQDIVEYIRSWYAGRHGIDALPPLPPPRELTPLVPVVRAHAPSAAEARHHAPRAKSAPAAPKGLRKRVRAAASAVRAAAAVAVGRGRRAAASRTRAAGSAAAVAPRPRAAAASRPRTTGTRQAAKPAARKTAPAHAARPAARGARKVASRGKKATRRR